MCSYRWGIASAVFCVSLAAAIALAQDQGATDQQQPQQQQSDGAGRRGGGDGNRDGRRWNPEEFRQRIADRMKQELQVNDEEWQVLEPKIEKVTQLQLNTRFGGLMGMFGRGGAGGGGGWGQRGDNRDANDAQRQESDYLKAVRELRTTLEDQNATPEQISQQLTALREARQKSQEELEAARNELKELVTQRQEAVLVMMGLLE